MEYFSQTFGALAFCHCRFFYFDYPDKSDKHDYLAASTGLSMCMLPAGFYFGYKLIEHRETLVWQRPRYLG